MSDGYRVKPANEDEKRFWDECVFRLAQGYATTSAHLRAGVATCTVESADVLLEKRRERFGAG